MAAVDTAGWQYADWQEESTPEARIEKLVQHITEARKAVVYSAHSEGRVQSMSPAYVTSLETQLKELRGAVNMKASFASGSAYPTVVRPQF